MNDDLTFLKAHIADYEAYADEDDRHESDSRVRAYVGKRLTDAQTKLASTLDAATTKELEELVWGCMFGDQRFIRHVEHAELEPEQIDDLLRTDRELVELGDRAETSDATSISPVLARIGEIFAERRKAAAPPAVSD